MEEKRSLASSENILQIVWYHFYPFWPLFATLAVLFLLLGFGVTLLLRPS